MKVLISNMTGFTKFVDLDGLAKTDDMVVVGPNCRRVKASVPSEKRFIELSKQYRGVLTIRKTAN